MKEKISLGRKKKLNNRGEEFLRFYLDPFIRPQEVCRAMNISQATYYRYIQELDVPTLRVSVTNFAEQAFENLLRKPLLDFQQGDLKLVRELAKRLRTRMVFTSTTTPELLLRNKQVDLAIGSLCWTQSRAKDLYHSHTYVFNDRPHGVLFQNKKVKIWGREMSRKKPILAVPQNSVHFEFANEHLQNQYEIRQFLTMASSIRALTSQQVHLALLHSSAGSLSSEIAIVSSPFYYDTFTTMLFHRDSQHLIPSVNAVLENLYEQNFFQKV